MIEIQPYDQSWVGKQVTPPHESWIYWGSAFTVKYVGKDHIVVEDHAGCEFSLSRAQPLEEL